MFEPLYIHALIESLKITLRDGKGRLMQEAKQLRSHS